MRTHIAALERDGIVEHVGTQRDTGGKPARVYALTGEGEELFPKAYALVLGGLVEELARRDGWEQATTLLRAIGQRAGRSLGGDVEIQRSAEGYMLQGYGCRLSAVTAKHPQVCALARALVEESTGEPVTECCERGDRPRCRFRIAEGP